MKWGLGLVVVAFVVMVAACALPGARGWECDDDSECDRGLVCRSMHGRGGYTSVCLGRDDAVYTGIRGNWIRLMIVPGFVLGAGIGIAGRVVAARKRRHPDAR